MFVNRTGNNNNDSRATSPNITFLSFSDKYDYNISGVLFPRNHNSPALFFAEFSIFSAKSGIIFCLLLLHSLIMAAIYNDKAGMTYGYN